MERAAHGLRPALLCKFNPLFSFLLPVDSAFSPDIATLGSRLLPLSLLARPRGPAVYSRLMALTPYSGNAGLVGLHLSANGAAGARCERAERGIYSRSQPYGKVL
jgi:hypothetical protein